MHHLFRRPLIRVLRLLPPLVITRQEADLGLEKIAAGLEELDRLIKEEK